MNTMKLSGAGLVGLLALALSGAATAEPPILVETDADPPRAIARYGHADLASASGQDALTARVRGAARRLCLYNGVEPLQLVACFSSAIEDAHAQMTRAVADHGTIRTAQRGHIEVARGKQRFVRCAFPMR